MNCDSPPTVVVAAKSCRMSRLARSTAHAKQTGMSLRPIPAPGNDRRRDTLRTIHKTGQGHGRNCGLMPQSASRRNLFVETSRCLSGRFASSSSSLRPERGTACQPFRQSVNRSRQRHRSLLVGFAMICDGNLAAAARTDDPPSCPSLANRLKSPGWRVIILSNRASIRLNIVECFTINVLDTWHARAG